MSSLLQEAVALTKSGQREAAEELLIQALKEQPDNEAAWMLLSGVTRNRAVKREALARALALNPENSLAQQGLERFSAPSTSPLSPAAPTSGPPVPADLASASPPETETPAPSAFDFEEVTDAAPSAEPQPDSGAAGLFDFSDDTPAGEDAPAFAEDSPPAEPSAPPPVIGGQEPAFDFSAEFPFPLEAEDSEDTTPASEPAEGSSTAADMAFDWGAFDLSGETPALDDDILAEPEEIQAEPEAPGPDLDAEPPFNFEEDGPAAALEAETVDQPDSDAGTGLTGLVGEPSEATDEPEPAVAAEPPPDLKEAEPAFDWDSAPAFDFDAEFGGPDPESAAAGQDDEQGDDWAARIAQEGAQTSGVELDDATKAALLHQQQKRQQNILIAATVLFVLAVICVGVLVVFDNRMGRYTILPPPAQVSREAPSPDAAGQASMNFNGFPASRARIEWTRANDAATCPSPGMGLEVDFGTVAPSPVSNQVCRGESCAFEKELNQEPVSHATVTYICGKEATVTLFR